MSQKRGNVFQQFGGLILSLVLVMVLSVNVVSANELDRINCSQDVESIYQSIRHSSPEYEGTESIITFQNEGMTLVCTLTIPNTKKKPPIVISLNGFGDTRNSLPVGSTGEGILERNSRILAENGIASLRVDYRGSGDSDGEYSMMSFSTQISDALAAIDYVCKNLNNEVNTKKLALLGWSQGGLVASIAASKDKRVSSVVLWAPVSHAPVAYERLLSEAGIKKGLALHEGQSAVFPLYKRGVDIHWDVLLGKAFFDDLYAISPLPEISKYKNPLLVVVAGDDETIWPQPAMGQVYLNYHSGEEKIIIVEGSDHTFNFTTGQEKVDQFIYWATAWFEKTIK